MHINYFDILHYLETGNGRDFAAFIFLKSKYRNSTIYKYSTGKAFDTGISRNSLKKYIHRFLELGWCEMRGRDVFFKQIIQFSKARKRVGVYIQLKNSINETLQGLRHLLLVTKEKQFNWMKKVHRDRSREDLLRDSDADTYCFLEVFENSPPGAVIQKVKNDAFIETYENCHFFLSFKKIAKWFGCSPAMAQKIMRKMEKSGLIKSFKKELGILRNRPYLDYFDFRIIYGDHKPPVFEGKPSKKNWCDFKKWVFPNSYIFSL